jgi:hypothetical protein
MTATINNNPVGFLKKLGSKSVTLSGTEVPYARIGIGALQELADNHPVLKIFVGQGTEGLENAPKQDLYAAQAELIAHAVGTASGAKPADIPRIAQQILEGVVPSEIEQGFHEIMIESFPQVEKAFTEARAKADASSGNGKPANRATRRAKAASTPKTR